MYFLSFPQSLHDALLIMAFPGGVVNVDYSQSLVAQIIDANIDHIPLPTAPVPK
jgi:hypothetical protein